MRGGRLGLGADGNVADGSCDTVDLGSDLDDSVTGNGDLIGAAKADRSNVSGTGDAIYGVGGAVNMGADDVGNIVMTWGDLRPDLGGNFRIFVLFLVVHPG